MSFEFYEVDLHDPDRLSNKLIDLSTIVYTRHFYASSREKEDLISIGVVKAYSLICDAQWDKSRGSLLNYLYSGIRNEMHNYLYRVNKEVCYSEFYDEGYDLNPNQNFLDIDFKIISDVCGSFVHYGNVSNLVAMNLKDMGFNIRNWNKSREVNSLNKFSQEFVLDLISRISGAVIWKSREFYL